MAALKVRLDLHLDGLSLLFAFLISGIGTLIVLYSGAYLSSHHHLGRFHAYLLTFMLAMLGLVLADNMVAMFVFWELTSIASFRLIGFRTVDTLWSAIGTLLERFPFVECKRYIRHYGYGQSG